jgi:outer membrane protein
VSLSTELSSSLNLFNGYADTAELENAKLALEAVRKTLTREQQTLVYETFSGFVQVLTNQALIEVREEDLEKNNKLLEQIETFQEAGRLSLSDLYQQQADTKQAQQDLLEAQQTLNNSKLELMQTLGLVPTVYFQVVAPDFDSLSQAFSEAELEGMKTSAINERADIEAQKLQIEAAGQQLRQAKAGLYPKVDLSTKLSTGYASDGAESFGEQLFEDKLDASIGVSVSFSIFDRNQTNNDIAKAKIQQRNEVLTLKEKQLQVGLEIEQAILDYRTTQQKLEVVASKLISTRQSMESYEERYQVGASTLIELSQARTDYTTAAYDQIEAEYNLVTQEMALAYRYGNMDPLFAALELEKN